MIEIKKILKKDVPKLLLDNTLWNFSFLTISKHRLLAHYKNPIIEENDIVLSSSSNQRYCIILRTSVSFQSFHILWSKVSQSPTHGLGLQSSKSFFLYFFVIISTIAIGALFALNMGTQQRNLYLLSKG